MSDPFEVEERWIASGDDSTFSEYVEAEAQRIVAYKVQEAAQKRFAEAFQAQHGRAPAVFDGDMRWTQYLNASPGAVIPALLPGLQPLAGLRGGVLGDLRRL